MKLLIICISLSLVACGKKGSEETPITCGSKPITSVWTRTNQSASFDFSGLVFGQNQTFTVRTSDNRYCTGTSRADGSSCAGSYTVSGMTWTGTGSSDPGCTSLNESGTYSKSDAGLRFCKTGSGCNDYQ